jgi:hypothetical protein
MNKLISKYTQKIANYIIDRLEIAMKHERDEEFQILLNLGLSLNEWCEKRGIELK